MKDTNISVKTAKLLNLAGIHIRNGSMYYKSKGVTFYTSKKGGISGNEETYIICSQSILQKILRDRHQIDITVITNWAASKRVYYVGLSYINVNNEIDLWFSVDNDLQKIEYSTYEKALEAGLQHSIQLIINKHKITSTANENK